MNAPSPVIEARDFWDSSTNSTTFDVRSPGEYQLGHIPGAVNLPLFDDDERATVGTTYANDGHDAAVMEGLRITGPKMASLAQVANDLSRSGENKSSEVLVHCWRGGMRSQSMAWLLGVAGLQPTVLEGGYKSFRRFAQRSIDSTWSLFVVSGLTGAGKTRILSALNDAGEQVCDLEALANHRGSAYGGIAQGDQPTTEQFENELFACLDRFDQNQRIWIEDEGNRIGKVVVPQAFYEQIRNAPAVFLDVDTDQRVENLMRDYQGLPVDGLIAATENIRKRLGHQKTDEAIAAIENGRLSEAVRTTLSYYDRTYLKASKKMPRSVSHSLSASGMTDEQIVLQCLQIAQENENRPQNRGNVQRV